MTKVAPAVYSSRQGFDERLARNLQPGDKWLTLQLRCTSLFVTHHSLPSHTFFEPVIAQVKFSYRMLEVSVFFFEIDYFISTGFANRVAVKSSLARFLEVLASAVVEIMVNALPAK
jgi:hypothetical protein